MSFNPLDIYARASRRLPLTPAERAMLKTVDQLLLASLAGAIVAVAQAALDGGVSLSFATLGRVFVYALATALLTGIAKLFRASGDAAFAALANALDGAAKRVPQPPPQAQAPQSSTNLYASRVSGTGLSADTGPQARQARQAFLARGGGSFPSFPSLPPMPSTPPSRSDLLQAQTRPTQAVSAATSSPRQPQAAQTNNLPPETPAPSQRVVAPPEASAEDAVGDDNGPPTMEMAAVRAGAGPIAPPPPVPPSEWLTK